MDKAGSEKRRAVLKQLLETRPEPTKPRGINYDNANVGKEDDDASPQSAQPAKAEESQADVAARRRARLAQLGIEAGGQGSGGGAGGFLAQRLGQGAGGEGQAGLGGGLGALLRARLANQGNGAGQGSPLGGGLLAQRLGQGAGQAAGQAAGQGGQQNRPILGQLLAQRLGQQGSQGTAAAASGDAVPGADAESTRAFLRQQIEKLQAKLADIDASKSGEAPDEPDAPPDAKT